MFEIEFCKRITADQTHCQRIRTLSCYFQGLFAFAISKHSLMEVSLLYKHQCQQLFLLLGKLVQTLHVQL